MRLVFYFLVIVGFLGCNARATDTGTVENTTISTQSTLDALVKTMVQYVDQIPYDTLAIPRTVENGKMVGQPSKNWTSGFYPGLLWQLYGYSKNEKLKEAAQKWSVPVEKEKNDGGTHDLGFKVYCPFGNAYKATKDDAYRQVFITAAHTLSTRFNPAVGAIRSWDHHAHLWDYPVIIDNMMNLEMLFEVSNLTGDSTLYHIANTHASTTLHNHFRDDNSSYHVVSYDTLTGLPALKHTHQGLHHESAWSRGQAWGLHGFTTAYRYTKNPTYLAQAEKIAKFIFTHPNLPEDLIPYWDYDAPNIPNEPRDVSAAAVAASGLLELATYSSTHAVQYRAWADKILTSLASPEHECTIAPFFLKHSVGSVPGKFEVDAPIIYADYYYVEALLRKHQIDS